MEYAIQLKVMQNQEVKDALLATGNKLLVEDSIDDYYWGQGKDGSGRNQLGKTLMDVREQLRRGQLTQEEDKREFEAKQTQSSEVFAIQMGQVDHMSSNDMRKMKFDSSLLKIDCKDYYP